METKVLDIKGKEIGTCALPDSLFAVKANPTFLHEVITAFLANQRSGTADTKTRSEVSGTGKKPWKQKGTGRARQGSLRAPQFRHGGVAFGPTPHSFRQYLPVAKRRAAVAQSLSAKFAEGNIVVLDSLTIKEPKTKAFAEVLNGSCSTTLPTRTPLWPAATWKGSRTFKRRTSTPTSCSTAPKSF